MSIKVFAAANYYRAISIETSESGTYFFLWRDKRALNFHGRQGRPAPGTGRGVERRGSCSKGDRYFILEGFYGSTKKSSTSSAVASLPDHVRRLIGETPEPLTQRCGRLSARYGQRGNSPRPQREKSKSSGVRCPALFMRAHSNTSGEYRGAAPKNHCRIPDGDTYFSPGR